MYPFPLFFPLLESYKGKFLLFSFHCLIHSYNLIQEFSRIPLSLRMSSASLRTRWSDGLTCSTTAYGTASRRTPRWSGSACGKKKGSAGFCLQITGSDIRTRCSASWTAGKADSRPPNIRGRASSAGSYRHAAGRPSSVTARRAGASARCGFGSGGRKFHTETGTIPLYNIILLIND